MSESDKKVHARNILGNLMKRKPKIKWHCPWCGKFPKVFSHTLEGHPTTWHVICENLDCPMSYVTGEAGTEDGVIDLWNSWWINRGKWEEQTVVGTEEMDLDYLSKGEETIGEVIPDVVCVGCAKEISSYGLVHGSGAYFLDYYCSKCWEKFRQENSRICKKCEEPVYRCCC